MSEPTPNTLSVTLTEDGNVTISFPQNELMARFLVDKARSLVDQEFAKQAALAQIQAQQQRVTIAHGNGRAFRGRLHP